MSLLLLIKRRNKFERYGVVVYLIFSVKYSDYIEIDPGKRFGKPIIIGTRISVCDVKEWLSNGKTIEEIISDFPELNEKQVKACVEFENRITTLFSESSGH